MTHATTWRRLLLALLYAISIALTWLVVVMFVLEMFVLPRPAVSVSEQLMVAPDGTPVIQVQSISGNNVDYRYRALDGDEIQVGKENWLTVGQVQSGRQPPGTPREQIDWRLRLLSTTDGGSPPVFWYLIRDREEIGRAYFAGFDFVSKLPIGYVTRQGFRQTLPPRDDWFEVQGALSRWAAVACSRRFLQPASYPMFDQLVEDTNIPASAVYVIDGNRLQEVDLIGRQVRTVFESTEPLQSVTIVAQPVAIETESEESADKTADGGTIDRDRPVVDLLAALSGGRILVINPSDGTAQAFPISAELADVGVNVVSLGPDELLVHTGRFYYGREFELYWLNSSGEITRQEWVQSAW